MNFGARSPMLAVARESSPVHPAHDHFPCLSPDSCATWDTSSGDSLRNNQANTREGRSGCVAPGVGVGTRHGPRRSAVGVGSQRNSLSPRRLTDIQEDGAQGDSAADLELPKNRYPSPSRHLPGLRDESHEGPKTRSVFVTQSGIQASGEDPDNVCRLSTVSRRRSDTDNNASNAFTQSRRGLSPMQSSQVDLSGELSSNVGLRHSRSAEQVPHVSPRLNRGSPPRLATADETQDQRMSLAEVEEVDRAALLMQPIATSGLSEMHRACSPELVAEMRSLAVPAVGGLRQSFPESSPSLKESRKRVESTESPIKKGVNRTHPTQERSSARLGPVHGMPHMVPEGAIDDGLEKRGKDYSKEKESGVPGCMDGGVAAIGASGADAVEKLKTGNGTFPRQTPRSTAPPSNPQVEPSAVTRHRSNALHIQDPRYSSALTLPSSRSFYTQRNTAPPSNSQAAASRGRSRALHNQGRRTSSDLTFPLKRSSRSRTSTSQAGETRPCNPDTNYASAVSTNTAVDTFLPHSVASSPSHYSRPPHIRNRLSEASGTTAFSTAPPVLAPPPHPPADNIARAPADRLNSCSHISNQPHKAGEQYPTSVLSPPTAIFSDQSCVSDTDEMHDITREARDPLCKRILRACDNVYYKLVLRAGRAQSSPEWVEASATEVIQGRASVEAESRHSKKWWRKSTRLIRQLAAQKPSSENNG
ncbi:hypothetical protein yc1106_00623 [Curvularia clavata]|uniref:Uncharacterized protein n=1 Tax=Curvularia clavata TaxID=95742 RepID=A0A9Q8Z081_CURCL|nr:hypothetical protein yc1106_00623 [Curvularia clavata]